ncbi:TonB-dependent receptor [Pedobacter nutrimenti]|uniref:SusC/RagA family TonB-linked outer membrane protein n=1 Tax=Pedobacter nutrimenti TaxID=1241337 RepID=UPI00292EFACB|nr:TonB-dependent receptor [Pedobacter nutrimenti]
MKLTIILIAISIVHASGKGYLKNALLTHKVLEKNIDISRKHQPDIKKIKLEEILKIQGIVTDSIGKPLPGVTVHVKKTTLGIITNTDGYYVINVANDQAVLIFSAVGYITKEVPVNNKLNINIQLLEDKKILNNVIVVGYGTQSKAKVTGAIATVKMDDILGDRPVSSVTQLLQNAVPGLQASIGSGQPGASTSLNIRGATSLNISGQTINQDGPLILVDNVPLNGSLSLLDPNDIETITVLKDAGSAAIYGARSAFGVVLVTTKKGKLNQKPQLNYSNNVIFANATNLPVKATAAQFLQSLKDMGTTGYWSGQDVDTWIKLYQDAQAHPGKYPDGVAKEGSAIYPVTTGDIIGEYLGNSAPQFQNNLSISGGTDKTNYRLALGSVKENGIIVPEAKQDYFKRYNIKSFLSTEVNKWFTAQLDAGYYYSLTSKPANFASLFANAIDFSPLVPTADRIASSGDVIGINGTPRGITLNGAPNTEKNSDIRITGRGILKPLPGLTITGEYTYDNLATNQVNYNKAFSIVRPTNFQDQLVGDGTYGLYNSGKIYNALNLFANYAKSFGSHHFSALAGYNREEGTLASSSVSRNGMISADFPSITNATGPIDASNNYDSFALNGLFWRLNYDYKDKYLIQLNQRYDGSSKFPANHRFGLFPSGSIGWIVSEEDFIKDNVPFVSLLKFRASLGEVGNQSINSYAFIPTLSKAQPYWLNGTGSYLNSLNAPGLINSNFTWETVRTLDFGLDFSLFKNRLNGSFDWFKRDTKNILASGATPLPGVLGAQAPLQNTASLRSTGYEFSVEWRDKIGSLSYHIGANLYDFTAKITKFDGNPNNLLSTYYVGQQLGEIWGYTTDRLYNIDDFIKGTLTSNLTGGSLKPGVPKYQGQNPNPGDVLFKDLNGDGIIYQGRETTADPGDKSVIANSTPRYQFGINGGISFKNFDFSFVLRGVAKREYYLASGLTFPDYGGFSTVFKHTLDYWTPTNPDAFYARIYSQASGNQTFNQRTIQTRYLLNGAYLQISNLGLGYTLPQSLLKKISISSLRVFTSLENPFIFSHLPNGLDPSVDNLGSGLGYPFLRKTSFGVNLTF